MIEWAIKMVKRTESRRNQFSGGHFPHRERTSALGTAENFDFARIRGKAI